MMSNWLGGSFISRAKKGDGAEDAKVQPASPVAAAEQRKALNWVIQNSFPDAAFGLTPDLLRHMTVDKWLDEFSNSAFEDSTWPLHEQIMAMQSSVLTQLLNTGTLGSVHDNELRVDDGQDALTVAEVMRTVKRSVWKELEGQPKAKYTPRTPLVSSLRRNLQREHVGRVVDLALSGDDYGAASKVVASLARMQLRELKSTVEEFLKQNRARLDDYSIAHLEDCHAQADKALNVTFTHRTNDSGGLGSFVVF